MAYSRRSIASATEVLLSVRQVLARAGAISAAKPLGRGTCRPLEDNGGEAGGALHLGTLPDQRPVERRERRRQIVDFMSPIGGPDRSEKLSDERIWQVVSYIRYLGGERP